MSERAVSRRALGRIGAGGAVAALAGLTIARVAEVGAQGADRPPTITTDGIAGGGSIRTGLGEATFSLAIFALDPGDGSTPTLHGSLVLRDASDALNPVTIQSDVLSEFTAYSTDLPEARQIIGWAFANGNGPFPFLLQVDDAGMAADRPDTFNLVFGEAAGPFLGGGDGSGTVCDCGGFSYSLRGDLVAGDLTRFAMA